jgi:hypothetical protein
MTTQSPLPPVLDRLQHRAIRVGVGGLVLCGLGAVFNPTQFFYSYLYAFLFWISVALGCLAIFMLHNLVRGAWGAVIVRFLEAGARTLPVMLLAFVPVLFGLRKLYLWARPDVLAHDALLQHKALYLNVPFFVLRTAIYFAVWIGLAFYLTRQERQRQAGAATADATQLRLRPLSGIGLVLYALTMTFAAVDWVMSLEPHWYSTIYGVIFIVGQALITLAFAIVLLALLIRVEPFAGVIQPHHVHDLGNLLLAFVMLWAYIAFSQFLIIWSANLPEEITWYLHRTRGGWEVLAMLLILLHFVLPFLVLLARGSKRRVQTLAMIAGLLLVMHLVELFWMVMPALHPSALSVHVLDIIAPIALGGIWMAAFLWQLRRHSLLPVDDPRLQRSSVHE